MKIVLAFDSFKGSLTAAEAVEAARDGVLAALPGAEIVSLPLADGGEGTAEALVNFWNQRGRTDETAGLCNSVSWVTCKVHDPLMRPVEARYAVSRDGKTAFIDMAAAAGLTLLADTERNPLRTTTFGVGELLRDALSRACAYIIIGIGGSATNDAGMGLLAALGVRFFDCQDNLLPPVGQSLARVARVDWSGLDEFCDSSFSPALGKFSGASIDVMCDVTNPLYGPTGAACVYAPQKGASPADVEVLDRGLRHFASVVTPSAGFLAHQPGSGAAGGLGFAFRLLGANLRRGVDVMLDAARLDHHLRGADLVITGEGKIDRQTLCGKLPFGVLARARSLAVPVLAVAGRVENSADLLAAGFGAVCSINPASLPLQEAMNPAVARRNLSVTVSRLLASYS